MLRVTADTDKQCYTVFLTVNATGGFMAPLIIFKGKHLYSSLKGTRPFDGVTYAVSEKGWMTDAIFQSYLDIICRDNFEI